VSSPAASSSPTAIDLLVVTPAGEVRDHSVPTGETRLITASNVLQALYELIGCSSVDVLRLTPEIDMWVDDEGLLQAHPPRINQLASYIATRLGFPFQLYAGTAVFSGGVDEAGYTWSLSKAARQTLIDLVDELRGISGR
jgi:hypothetical protein